MTNRPTPQAAPVEDGILSDADRAAEAAALRWLDSAEAERDRLVRPRHCPICRDVLHADYAGWAAHVDGHARPEGWAP
jgi:hypothetical protein